MLYPECDELYPVVKMEPKRSYEVEISTPGRIAALEAEVERLREELAVYADEANWVYASFIGPGMGPGLHGGDGGANARKALEPTP